MEASEFIIPVLFVAILCSGWVVVQILARKMKTKNHFDDLGKGDCMSCTCGAGGDSEKCETKKT